MPHYNPDRHHRRSIRLRHYDYAQPGIYFITMCVAHQACLFGTVVDGAMQRNEYGQIAHEMWLQTPAIRPNVLLDAFVIMPNHMHAIVIIDRDGRDHLDRTGVSQYAPTPNPPYAPTPKSLYKPMLKSPSQTVGAIVRGYKGATTKQINLLSDTPGVPVWQRNYYEHIIRNEAAYQRIAEYIEANPARWEDDRYYSNRA